MIYYGWNDFFFGPNVESKGGNISEDGQYYIHDCQFLHLKNKAIYYTAKSDSNKLLVETSLFQNISSSKSGGAIYFNGKGDCCIFRICAHKSFSTSFSIGDFCYIDNIYKNTFINCSTVSFCGTYEKGNEILSFWNHHIQLSKINISYCNIKTCSAFAIYNEWNKPLCEYSSFKNCSSSDKRVILFQTSNPGNLHHCNVLSSNASQTISIYSCPLTVESCYFVNNPKSPFFYAQYKKLTIIRCYLENSNRETIVVDNGVVDLSSINTNLFDLKLDNLLHPCSYIELNDPSIQKYEIHNNFKINFGQGKNLLMVAIFI